MDLSLSQTTPSEELGFTFGNLRLEPDGTLFRGSETVHLAPKELAALRVLLTNPARIVHHAQLKEILWPDVHVTDDSVPRCISSLRSRLGSEVHIRTIYKRGYRLESPVHPYSSSQESTLPRLAILPFVVEMCVPEHLGPGIAEQAAIRLSEFEPPLAHVLPIDSILTLAGRGLRPHEIGRTMNADFVLAGSLRTSAAFFKLRVEMIRVSKEMQIWAEDILAPRQHPEILEQRLVERLAFRLGLQLPIAMSASAGQIEDHGADAAAYDAFLAGRHERRSHDYRRMQNALAMLSKAANLDRNNVAAREELVTVSVDQCLYGYSSPAAAAESIRHAAEGIPGQISQSILPALGWVLFHVEHNIAFASRMLRVTSPAGDNSRSTTLAVMFALSRLRFDQACLLLDNALRDNSFSPSLHALLAWTHHLAGNFKASLEEAGRSLALFPGDDRVELCAALVLAFNDFPRRGAELAHQVAQRQPALDAAAAIEAYALARCGRPNEARTILERLQWLGRERYVMSSFTAAAYAELGDVDGAVAELHTAFEARCPWFFQALADPRLSALRDDPRYDHLRRKLLRIEAEVVDESA